MSKNKTLIFGDDDNYTWGVNKWMCDHCYFQFNTTYPDYMIYIAKNFDRPDINSYNQGHHLCADCFNRIVKLKQSLGSDYKGVMIPINTFTGQISEPDNIFEYRERQNHWWIIINHFKIKYNFHDVDFFSYLISFIIDNCYVYAIDHKYYSTKSNQSHNTYDLISFHNYNHPKNEHIGIIPNRNCLCCTGN